MDNLVLFDSIFVPKVMQGEKWGLLILYWRLLEILIQRCYICINNSAFPVLDMSRCDVIIFLKNKFTIYFILANLSQYETGEIILLLRYLVLLSPHTLDLQNMNSYD